MKSENYCFYSLKEISEWQLDFENSKIELPPLQRGFVWKAYQIEKLWDSILRGFPIGAFLLSKSKDEKLFLFDGQQRATSIAIGHYDPWHNEKNEQNKFWSLKNIPVLWIDLNPLKKTPTQKFVFRVITQSHPWGYQLIEHSKILGIQDRKNSLKIFREIPENKEGYYIQLSPLKVFPYDSNLPVPFSFVIKAIQQQNENWVKALIKMCFENLPFKNIKTKYFNVNSKPYLEQLAEILNNSEFSNEIYAAIKNLQHLEIPGLFVKKEILKDEEEQTNDDPTLFVRLNTLGTKISHEELIYSIYKASFPEAKLLVENIGANFVPPSLVISLVSRLAIAEINENQYPSYMSVNDFRKKIIDEQFKNKLKELIGNQIQISPARMLFDKAINILRSKDDFAIPPVLVKNIVKGSPDLFLMLLQWIKSNDIEITAEERKKILATLTALSWFGRDNIRFVRTAWSKLSSSDFWSNQDISNALYKKNDFIIYPFLSPIILREYLLEEVVERKVEWHNLVPKEGSKIYQQLKLIFNEKPFEEGEENKIDVYINDIWQNFKYKIFGTKSLVLYAQRNYINENFGEFNQMDILEDTNTPWDWDHIYPISWVYCKKGIDNNTRHWTNAIGNFRAISLEENRSESNYLSPKARLLDVDTKIDVRTNSFIKENDWDFWNKITDRINEGDNQMVNVHLSAIVHRLCNIYEEWFNTLNIGELFKP